MPQRSKMGSRWSTRFGRFTALLLGNAGGFSVLTFVFVGKGALGLGLDLGIGMGLSKPSPLLVGGADSDRMLRVIEDMVWYGMVWYGG